MDLIEACILGIVQGATEFLPISSSGHLVILHQLFGEGSASSISFDVALHVGTLLAVVTYFFGDLKRLAASLARPQATADRKLLGMLAIGTIPAVAVGYFFEEVIAEMFRTVESVAIMLIVVAVLMWLVEYFAKPSRPLASVTWRDGILIGLAQALALIPGTSRSGITIITGMTLRLSREAAARFSFLLAIPAVFGAAVKQSFELSEVTWTTHETVLWVLGILTAAASGWMAIRWLLKYLQQKRLYPFVWYRIALGLALLIFFAR